MNEQEKNPGWLEWAIIIALVVALVIAAWLILGPYLTPTHIFSNPVNNL